jgi:hypothetical protein
MDKLHRLVTDHLMERLFRSERLAAMLASLSGRLGEKAESLSSRLMALRRRQRRPIKSPRAYIGLLRTD